MCAMVRSYVCPLEARRSRRRKRPRSSSIISSGRDVRLRLSPASGWCAVLQRGTWFESSCRIIDAGDGVHFYRSIAGLEQLFCAPAREHLRTRTASVLPQCLPQVLWPRVKCMWFHLWLQSLDSFGIAFRTHVLAENVFSDG